MSVAIAWLVVCLAVFLIGLAKSGLGAGLALVVVPICAIALDHTPRGSDKTLGLLLPLLLVGDVLSVWQYRRLFDFALIRPLVLPALVGIAIGSAVLWLIHSQANQARIAGLVRLEIGLECVALVALHWYRVWRGDAVRLMREPLRAWIAGTYTGISTTLAHAAGPVVAMYLLPLKPDRRAFVGSSAVFFALANATKLPGYWMAGQFAGVDAIIALRLVPLVVFGAIVGFWLNKRMTDFGFLRFVYAATFAIGLYLAIDGAAALVRAN